MLSEIPEGEHKRKFSPVCSLIAGTKLPCPLRQALSLIFGLSFSCCGFVLGFLQASSHVTSLATVSAINSRRGLSDQVSAGAGRTKSRDLAVFEARPLCYLLPIRPYLTGAVARRDVVATNDRVTVILSRGGAGWLPRVLQRAALRKSPTRNLRMFSLCPAFMLAAVVCIEALARGAAFRFF